MRAKHGVARQCLNHGTWIGQARGLDNDTVKIRNEASATLAKELAQRVLQIGAHTATQAAVGQQAHVLGRHLDQVVVDPNLAHLIDHHGHPIHVGVPYEFAHQGGLACAQKASDQGDRNLAGEHITCARRCKAVRHSFRGCKDHPRTGRRCKPISDRLHTRR